MSSPSTPILMAPGPVVIPDYVREALARPVIHQRTAAFYDFLQAFQQDLRYLFQTEHDVLALAGSGTFAVEAAIASIFRPGDKVVVPEYGKFSMRWTAFALKLGLDLVPVALTWGHEFKTEHVRQILEEHPDIKGWVLTHVETSTGVAVDLEEMAFAIREADPEQLIVVDAICSVGIQPVYTDAWDLDVVVAASQKGLSNPAGTSYAAVSPRAALRISVPEAAEYWHFGHYLRYLRQGSYPFTPPVQLFFGVQAELERLRETGLPERWNRTHSLSRYFKEAVADIAGGLYGAANADALTVFHFGREDCDRVRERLVVEHGIELAGGQERLEGLIIRIGHFGPYGMAETKACIEALRAVAPKQKA